MSNLQMCLSYLRDIDFDRATLQAAREEVAGLTQRANAALPPTLLAERQPTSDDVERAATLAWNEALTHAAAAARATCHSFDEGTRAVTAIRALKRTT